MSAAVRRQYRRDKTRVGNVSHLFIAALAIAGIVGVVSGLAHLIGAVTDALNGVL